MTLSPPDTAADELSGASLRLMREELGIGMAELARTCGVTRQSIGGTEALARVGPQRAHRYVEGLRQLAVVTSASAFESAGPGE